MFNPLLTCLEARWNTGIQGAGEETICSTYGLAREREGGEEGPVLSF